MNSKTIKFLSLNIFRGKCLESVLSFIEKEQFDIIQLQEVSGDFISFNNVNDCFEVIKNKTGLNGELLISWNHRGNKKAYFGNATFYRPEFKMKERKELRYTPFQEIEFPDNPPVPKHPRATLFLKLEGKGKDLWCVNAHQVWGPTPYDEPYKMVHAKMLAEEVSKLSGPFVISGDFNVVPSTEIIASLEPYARNLTKEYGLVNTLDPHIHRAGHLFPPGLAVDYIFTHPSIVVKKFDVIDQMTLSDHMALVATLE